jgi:hypothetical protein
MKLQNCGPNGEMFKLLLLNLTKVVFFVCFTKHLRFKKYKNARPDYVILIKNLIKFYLMWQFLQLNKKLTNFICA